MNRTVLIGRTTKDIELSYSPNGVAVAKFTLAVNRPFKNANGERETDFITCVAFRKTAETMANYLTKGNQVGVEGRIQTGRYERDGKTVFTTDVSVDQFYFLESKKDKQQASQSNQQTQQYQQQSPQNNPIAQQGTQITDSDLPF